MPQTSGCHPPQLLATSGFAFATAFPLFSKRMFAALTYKWGNTLFALVAAMMIPIPFVRASSLFHCSIENDASARRSCFFMVHASVRVANLQAKFWSWKSHEQ
jgi:hypothetical protein